MAEQKWKLFIRPDYDASRIHLKIHWRKSFTRQIMHPLTMIMVWRSAEKWKKTKNTAPAEWPLCRSPTPPPPWHFTEVKCSRSFLVLLDVFQSSLEVSKHNMLEGERFQQVLCGTPRKGTQHAGTGTHDEQQQLNKTHHVESRSGLLDLMQSLGEQHRS